MRMKLISVMLMALVVVAVCSPLVSASSEEGTGQSRTVTLADSFVDTNTTVIVPTILNNETANSFAFVVADESGVWGSNYTFNITIYDNNVTWYNGTVDVVGVPSENTTGYINFTADQIAIVNDANITITMQWDNWTASNDDVWYGEVDFVDQVTYDLRVTTPSLLISVMGIGIILIVFAGIFNSTFKSKKKQ